MTARRRGRSTWSARQPELGQQRAHVGVGQSGHRVARTRRAAAPAPRNSPRAWSISPTPHRRPEPAVPSSSGIRPSSAPSSVDLPEPFAPGDRDPVAPSRPAASTGPSGEPAAPHDRAAQGGHDGARRAAPRRSPSAAPTPCAAPRPRRAARSAARSAGPSRPASRWSARGSARDVLVVVGGLAPGVAHALGHPVALHARARLQRRLRVGVLLVRLARVPAGDLALGEVGFVAAVVAPRPAAGRGPARRPG